MKEITKKIISFVLLMSMMIQTFSPAVVFATTQDCDEVTIVATGDLNGDDFAFDHGDVNVTKNGTERVLDTTFSVEEGDSIVITLKPKENYTGKLLLNGEEVTLDNSTYSFTVGSTTDSTLTFTPVFEAVPVKYSFRLNGKDFTDIENGTTLTVDSDFNMDSITEFYITEIVTSSKTYTYTANDYSKDLLNSSSKAVLEINTSKISKNYIKMRIQSHPSDNKYYEFYLPEINIKKAGFKGVEVTTNVMPDSYDFTTWNGVDLADTTESNPGEVTVYYGENTINLENDNIASVELVTNQGVPEDAVNINTTTHKVTVLSNYYNVIPLKVTLTDGTVGYINVNRIGIFIGYLNKGDKVYQHGASADVGENLNVDTDKNRIVAVFYHSNAKSGSAYKLVVNITYEDGSTETQIAKYVGDVDNSSGDIVGSDYILWEGNNNSPAKVSVTAVEADALTDEDYFGGATFGSGEGVTWEMR